MIAALLCVVLDCSVAELLIPEPGKVSRPGAVDEQQVSTAGGGAALTVVPRRRDGRSLPPA